MDIFQMNVQLSDSSLKQVPVTCNGHTRPIVHLNFSNISDTGDFYLISASKDGKPQLRQGNTGDWIGTFEGHKGAVWGVALNKNAQLAGTASADFTAKIWNTNTGDELYSFKHRHIVKSVDFNNSDNCLLTSSNEKTIRIFDLSNINSEPQIFSGHENHIRHAIFSNDEGNQFVSCSDDKTVKFWDRRCQQKTISLSFDQIPTSIEISNDKTILTICYGNYVMFYDLLHMKELSKFKAPTLLETCSLHPDNSVFVCGGQDFLIYKYRFSDFQQIDSFNGHFGAVHCLRFSPDGELYASGSEDGTLRLWQNTIGKTYGLWKFVDGLNEGLM